MIAARPQPIFAHPGDSEDGCAILAVVCDSPALGLPAQWSAVGLGCFPSAARTGGARLRGVRSPVGRMPLLPSLFVLTQREPSCRPVSGPSFYSSGRPSPGLQCRLGVDACAAGVWGRAVLSAGGSTFRQQWSLLAPTGRGPGPGRRRSR